jgi:RNA polymerase sigma-70 factor (ECF subfamily)
MANHTEVFATYRPLLFAIAYRMLGSVADAEDITQEAFLSWNAAEEPVHDAKAYLTTLTSRLCINHLHSARVQREVYVGPWLPEPLLTEQVTDPGARVELAESLSMAFLVLLETLSPMERAVFLLHDVFDYDFGEVAGIVERSETNCRQMAHRARQRLAERRPRFTADREACERVTAQFVTACASGDLHELMATLSADVTLLSDGGGKVHAALNPIYGPEKVARFLLGVLRKMPAGFSARMAEINGQPGIIGYADGQPHTILTLDIWNDGIHGVYIEVNPEKLMHLPPERAN